MWALTLTDFKSFHFKWRHIPFEWKLLPICRCAFGNLVPAANSCIIIFWMAFIHTLALLLLLRFEPALTALRKWSHSTRMGQIKISNLALCERSRCRRRPLALAKEHAATVVMRSISHRSPRNAICTKSHGEWVFPLLVQSFRLLCQLSFWC